MVVLNRTTPLSSAGVPTGRDSWGRATRIREADLRTVSAPPEEDASLHECS